MELAAAWWVQGVALPQDTISRFSRPHLHPLHAWWPFGITGSQCSTYTI